MTVIQGSISPIKKKHIFSLQDAEDNAPVEEFSGTKTWDIHSHRPTTYRKDMVPFIASQAKKASDKAIEKAEKLLKIRRN